MEISERLERELQDAMARLRRLGQEIGDETGSAAVAAGETVAEIVDAAQGVADRDMHFATRSLLKARVNRLVSALARLNTGSYGKCEECGAAIAPARLAALPEVTSCLPCQDRHERGAHRHRDHHAARAEHRHRPHHAIRAGSRQRATSISA